jgi:hypothetical protein
VWLATICVRAVDACFALGGGSALYETSPLQRRLRDLHAAAQHGAVQQLHYASAGKLRLSSVELDDRPPEKTSMRIVSAPYGVPST